MQFNSHTSIIHSLYPSKGTAIDLEMDEILRENYVKVFHYISEVETT